MAQRSSRLLCCSSLSESLRALVFSFTSVKSHRLLGSASKSMHTASGHQHAWPLRLRVMGSVFGLHYAKQCDWKLAETLLDAAPASADVDCMRAVLWLTRIHTVRDCGAILADRAVVLLESCAKSGHFWSRVHLGVFQLMAFERSWSSPRNDVAVRLQSLIPELKQRADNDCAMALSLWLQSADLQWKGEFGIYDWQSADLRKR
jgi:hypothetical protein